MILISATEKRPGAEQEIRLFMMNDSQASLFEGVVEGLVRNGTPLWTAALEVEKAVVAMLAGKMPPEEMPSAMHRLRFAFPVLRPSQVKKLPRVGCPGGHVTAFIMQVKVPVTTVNEDGVTTAEVIHTVRVDMNEEQADFYNFALQKFIEVHKLSKDEAWKRTNDHVGRLFTGKEDRLDEEMAKCADLVFPKISLEELMAMPQAGEDDLRRWHFTKEPI